MTIEYFADQQNVVFIPALVALLVAVLLICLPIVFAPALRRGPRSRSRAVAVVAGVVAAVALVTAGWQAGVGIRTLQAERASVADRLQQRYGLGLTDGEVGELIDGGAPDKAYPALVQSLDLRQNKSGKHALRFAETDGSYGLTYGGVAVPTR